MKKSSSEVSCYRDRITYDDRVYQIETHDTGPDEGAVTTRVMDEDGRLLASRTTTCADVLDGDDCDEDERAALVQLIAEEQHQAMITAVRDGCYEEEMRRGDQPATKDEAPPDEHETPADKKEALPDEHEPLPQESSPASECPEEANAPPLEGSPASEFPESSPTSEVLEEANAPLLVAEFREGPTSLVNLFGMMTLDEAILNSLVSPRR